jgi:hypothetical protein
MPCPNKERSSPRHRRRISSLLATTTMRPVDFGSHRSTIGWGSSSVTVEEDAMKFMFMIYHDENVLDAIPEEEMQALVDSAIEYSEEIERSGHYIASDALQRTATARTIRVRAGKVTTTDGPFAETKEQLGGFFLVDAKDMDEACAIASRFPPARVGIIEVRPVQELTHSRDRRSLPR